MKMALKTGGLNAEDVSYINAHGTSTPVGDVCETQAIKTVFGERAKKVAVSSTKGATGHMLGAAGAVEMAVCAMAIKHGVVPPTINLQTPDPECDLDYVPNTARELPVNAIVNNSFGFGGHNSTIAATKFKGVTQPVGGWNLPGFHKLCILSIANRLLVVERAAI